ncbi:MAG: hypothetical protein HY291_07005 [Planctomycetes bacterium]|nr:hypothetical protein [Planctomycetota bacterium]
MSDTTVIKKPSDAKPASARKAYSESAVREAYYKLLKEFHDPDKTLNLVSRSCHLAVADIQRIVQGHPAPPPPQDRKEAPPKDDTKLIAPEPAAMLAFKHFTMHNPTLNATILVAVHGQAIEAGQALTANGFATLPIFDQQNEFQRAIVLYVSRVLEVKADEGCFGAKNVQVEGAEEKVGRASSRGLPLDHEIFEPFVAPLREALAAVQPSASLHFLSLPPLDLERLARKSNTVVLERMPAPNEQPVELVTDKFLRARSRDLVFVDWVAKRWPQGGPLDEVIAATAYAEWLIALLSYTRYSSHTLEGKRMLTRLACVCATRAQRWSPSTRLRHALAAAERWTEEPTEENRAAAEVVKKELSGPPPEGEKPPEGPGAYAWQAAMESTLRAVSCAGATDPSRISSHCSRAAAAAVMAASFAATAKEDSTWIDMMRSRTAPDESAEQTELCNAIRAVIYKK